FLEQRAIEWRRRITVYMSPTRRSSGTATTANTKGRSIEKTILTSWESFYVIVGSSGAALTGLQVVGIARGPIRGGGRFGTRRPRIRGYRHAPRTPYSIQAGDGGLDLAHHSSVRVPRWPAGRFAAAPPPCPGGTLHHRWRGAPAAVHRHPQCVGHGYLHRGPTEASTA